MPSVVSSIAWLRLGKTFTGWTGMETGVLASLFRMQTETEKEDSSMILSTTHTIEGRPIRAYHGIVTGEAVMGTNLVKELFGAVRDIIGGRSGSYEKELARARKVAFEEIERQAMEMGANAVVGIDIDYQTLGVQNGMLMVSITGTAVTVL
jgi:uncharacterized protein YbjQ (UPF0145 family)